MNGASVSCVSIYFSVWCFIVLCRHQAWIHRNINVILSSQQFFLNFTAPSNRYSLDAVVSLQLFILFRQTEARETMGRTVLVFTSKAICVGYQNGQDITHLTKQFTPTHTLDTLTLERKLYTGLEYLPRLFVVHDNEALYWHSIRASSLLLTL